MLGYKLYTRGIIIFCILINSLRYLVSRCKELRLCCTHIDRISEPHQDRRRIFNRRYICIVEVDGRIILLRRLGTVEKSVLLYIKIHIFILGYYIQSIYIVVVSPTTKNAGIVSADSGDIHRL